MRLTLDQVPGYIGSLSEIFIDIILHYDPRAL